MGSSDDYYRGDFVKGVDPYQDGAAIYIDDQQYSLKNPGQVDVYRSNPHLGQQLRYLENARSRFDDSMVNALNPVRYRERKMEAQARAETDLMNRYGSLGLAGSSVALGAADDANRRLEMEFDERQLMDELRALQAQQSLTGAISAGIMAGQSQFAGWQNQYFNLLQGLEAAENQANAADNAIWASLIGAGGMIGGAALAGPPGASGGSMVGNTAGRTAFPSSPGGTVSGYGMPSNYSPGDYGGAPLVNTQPYSPGFGDGFSNSYPSYYYNY